MTIVNLSPDDTLLRENGATTNYSTAAALWVGESNGASSANAVSLLKFSFVSIPTGSAINSATLYLYHTDSAQSSNTRTMHVYRVIRNWVLNQTTWNIAKTGTNWGTSGAGNTTTDYNNTSLGSRSFVAAESNGWKTISLDTSIISQLVNGSLSNEGLILRMETELNDQQRFSSMEGTNPPYLEIDYSPGGRQFQVVMFM